VPILPGVNHLNAVRALEKSAFLDRAPGSKTYCHVQCYEDRYDPETQSCQCDYDGQDRAGCRSDNRWLS